MGLCQIPKGEWVSLCAGTAGARKHTCDQLQEKFPGNWGEVYDQISKLTALELNSKQISDIYPLIGLSNLEKLHLFNNQISDLAPLAWLSNLKELSLGGNKIADIAPLAVLSNLNMLILFENEISDISPLERLGNLEMLLLFENQIADLSPLANLVKLRQLDLDNNQITDLTPLAGLTELEDLHLGVNRISTLAPLSGLFNLEDLHIGGNQFLDLTPLAGLPKLNTIFPASIQIPDLPLEPMEQVESDMVSDSSFSSLEEPAPNEDDPFNLEQFSLDDMSFSLTIPYVLHEDFLSFEELEFEYELSLDPIEYELIRRPPGLTEVNNPDVVCPICLNAYGENDLLAEIPNCHHVFHEQCLGIWLNRHGNCPFCRAALLIAEDSE